MTTPDSRKRRPGVLGATLVVLGVLGGLAVGLLIARLQAPKPPPAAESGGTAPEGPDPHQDEMRVLRADVARLSRVVGTMAARPPVPSAAANAADRRHQPPRPVPEIARITKDELAARFQKGAPNPQKTRALATSLGEIFKKESFAAAQVHIEEVDCRGELCRARVSLAEDAPAETVASELAAAVPDSHSAQEASPPENHRRVITSVYLSDANAPGVPLR